MKRELKEAKYNETCQNSMITGSTFLTIKRNGIEELYEYGAKISKECRF